MAGRLVPQVLVCEKSPGFAPDRPIWVMVKALALVLVRVTAIGALDVTTFCPPKFTPIGEIVTTVAAPKSEAVCGLGTTLSVMESFPVEPPLAVGA